MNSSDKMANSFVIFVDRIEGKYAVCELPDETMCDIEKSVFPEDLKEREKFEAEVLPTGDVKIIKRCALEASRHHLPTKLIRF